jgi:CheY-like chemotaxis protein
VSAERYPQPASKRRATRRGIVATGTGGPNLPSPPIQATVLVVEDQEDSREALGQIVASLGHRVVFASNGRRALERLKTTRPDVILCDLRMPFMDGFALVAALRRHPRFAGIKLVAVTALGGPEDLQRTHEAGFDGHLTKPIDYDRLVALLHRILPPKR